jgi:hypothetical protein
VVNEELIPLLNLLRDNPTFVIAEDDSVIQVPSVPPGSGMTLIAGTTVAAVGDRIESVFEVEADGGELFGVYWRIDGEWFASSDDTASLRLGLDRADVFPFDWELAVPLDVDFHQDPPEPHRPKLP